MFYTIFFYYTSIICLQGNMNDILFMHEGHQMNDIKQLFHSHSLGKLAMYTSEIMVNGENGDV